jgi:single-strand DNA-binding protein
MAFEIIGKVIDIAPVNQVSDKFRKREFVIEKKETGGAAVFIDYIKFQLVQDKCDLINESFMNEEIRIWFNLKGNRWERDGKVNYFTNLDAWKIEKVSSQGRDEAARPVKTFEDIPPEVDELSDLPF